MAYAFLVFIAKVTLGINTMLYIWMWPQYLKLTINLATSAFLHSKYFSKDTYISKYFQIDNN